MVEKPVKSAAEAVAPAIRLTDEQEAIVRSGLASGTTAGPERRVVKAFAGTGKTSTSRAYALARPKSRMLYMAYNRSIRDAAHTSFPRNVDCKTAHQLAYAAFGAGYARADKLSNRFGVGQIIAGATDIATRIFGRRPTHPELSATVDIINGFCCSRDPAVSAEHLPDTARRLLHAHHASVGHVVGFAERCWERMRDPADKRLPMTHDGYLKLYQLSAPALNYDEIIFDEAQDANPVIAEIVRSQSCGLLALGDPHQQIYQFRGAENFLDEFSDAEQFALTESFRFGPELARMASAFLAAHKLEMQSLGSRQAPTQIRGDASIIHSSPWCDPSNQNMKAFMSGLAATESQEAVLARGTFQSLLMGIHFQRSRALRNKRLHYIGGLDGYRLDMALDIWNLTAAPHKVKNPLMRDLISMKAGERLAAIHEFFGADAETLAGALKHLEDFPRLVDALRGRVTERRMDADIIISTVHRAKGLEFPSVRLMAGIEGDTDSLPAEEEINVCYVGMTRARNTLHVSPALHAFHAKPDEAVRNTLEARPWKKPARPHRRAEISMEKKPKPGHSLAWQSPPWQRAKLTATP